MEWNYIVTQQKTHSPTRSKAMYVDHAWQEKKTSFDHNDGHDGGLEFNPKKSKKPNINQTSSNKFNIQLDFNRQGTDKKTEKERERKELQQATLIAQKACTNVLSFGVMNHRWRKSRLAVATTICKETQKRK